MRDEDSAICGTILDCRCRLVNESTTNPRRIHESYRGLERVWDITVYFAPGPDYSPAGNVVAAGSSGRV